jgi:hypothetical protein
VKKLKVNQESKESKATKGKNYFFKLYFYFLLINYVIQMIIVENK